MRAVDLDESKLPNVDTFFSAHSRPQTPSCSVAQPIGDDNSSNENNDDDGSGSLHSLMVNPADVCLFPEENPIEKVTSRGLRLGDRHFYHLLASCMFAIPRIALCFIRHRNNSLGFQATL